MLSCPRCKSRQLPNTLFCDECGEEIEVENAPVGVQVTVRLELLDSRRTINLPDLPELTLGRASGDGNVTDVPLDQFGGREGGVSRHHARLSRRGMNLYLEDLGSLNGSYINEQRLRQGTPTRIYPGDIIRLGLLRMTFMVSTY